jgi:hypothetical protein
MSSYRVRDSFSWPLNVYTFDISLKLEFSFIVKIANFKLGQVNNSPS